MVRDWVMLILLTALFFLALPFSLKAERHEPAFTGYNLIDLGAPDGR
jgi:hypothetical protein